MIRGKTEPAGRDHRLDALRALGIVLVLLWHIQPLRFSPLGLPVDQSIPSLLPNPMRYLLELFNLQFTLIAVPLFYLVSLYLFYSHFPVNSSYLKDRLSRISKLCVFWTAVQFAVYFTVCSLGLCLHSSELECEPLSFFSFAGPSLPMVGDSVFYFLFDLLLLTILAFLYARMNDRMKMPIGVATILGFAIYFEMRNLGGVPIPYWSPGNFVIYIPIAYMLRHTRAIYEFRYYLLGVFVVLSVLVCLNPWCVLSTVSVYSAYARVGIVLGAVGVFSTINSLNLSERNRFVEFLSRYSLGIFAIHKYLQLSFILIFHKAFSAFEIPDSLVVFDVQLNLVALAVGVSAIAFSLVCVKLLGRTPLRQYVTS